MGSEVKEIGRRDLTTQILVKAGIRSTQRDSHKNVCRKGEQITFSVIQKIPYSKCLGPELCWISDFLRFWKICKQHIRISIGDGTQV